MRLLVLLALLLAPAQGNDSLAEHAASAAAAMKSGDYPSAETHYRAIAKLRPEIPEALVNLGLSCYLQRKYVEAAGHFEAGLKKKPDMANASLLLGLTRFHLNRPADAVGHLETYVARRADDFQGVYFLGLSYLALDEFDKAEKSLAAARGMQPQNSDVLYHLAQVHLGRARANPQTAQAIWPQYQALVNQLSAVDPDSVRLAQLRAGFFEATGKKPEAIRELEAAVAKRPKIRGLYYTLGCLYLEGLQYDQAVEQFQLELKLESPFPRTNLQLAHAYIQSNRADQALPHLERAAAIEPRDAGMVWLEIARAQRALNRFGEAVTAYQKAIAAGERDASVYYQLAAVAKRAGKDEIAREALEASKKLRKSAASTP